MLNASTLISALAPPPKATTAARATSASAPFQMPEGQEDERTSNSFHPVRRQGGQAPTQETRREIGGDDNISTPRKAEQERETTGKNVGPRERPSQNWKQVEGAEDSSSESVSRPNTKRSQVGNGDGERDSPLHNSPAAATDAPLEEADVESSSEESALVLPGLPLLELDSVERDIPPSQREDPAIESGSESDRTGRIASPTPCRDGKEVDRLPELKSSRERTAGLKFASAGSVGFPLEVIESPLRETGEAWNGPLAVSQRSAGIGEAPILHSGPEEASKQDGSGMAVDAVVHEFAEGVPTEGASLPPDPKAIPFERAMGEEAVAQLRDEYITKNPQPGSVGERLPQVAHKGMMLAPQGAVVEFANAPRATGATKSARAVGRDESEDIGDNEHADGEIRLQFQKSIATALVEPGVSSRNRQLRDGGSIPEGTGRNSGSGSTQMVDGFDGSTQSNADVDWNAADLAPEGPVGGWPAGGGWISGQASEEGTDGRSDSRDALPGQSTLSSTVEKFPGTGEIQSPRRSITQTARVFPSAHAEQAVSQNAPVKSISIRLPIIDGIEGGTIKIDLSRRSQVLELRLAGSTVGLQRAVTDSIESLLGKLAADHWSPLPTERSASAKPDNLISLGLLRAENKGEAPSTSRPAGEEISQPSSQDTLATDPDGRSAFSGAHSSADPDANGREAAAELRGMRRRLNANSSLPSWRRIWDSFGLPTSPADS